MKKQKLQGFLKTYGVAQVQIANKLGITSQSVSRKLLNANTSATLKDLIIIADATGTTLAFNDENGKPVITFDMDDLKD